jgi:hypothetical protein
LYALDNRGDGTRRHKQKNLGRVCSNPLSPPSDLTFAPALVTA